MDFYNKNLLASVFRHLTKLDQLVSLSIGGGDTIIDTINTIIDGLRQLSDKLLKLKSLIIDTSINSLALFLSFMSEVKKFKALERLSFILYLDEYDEVLKPFEEYFKGLQSLAHLEIEFWSRQPSYVIQNDLLKDIDKSLPKLLVLCLNFSIEVS